MQEHLIFYILAFIAEVIGTISGFGSSILFVPIASLFFDFQTVLGVTAVFHVFSNLSKIALFRKGIDKKIVIRLGIPAVIFVIIGAWLSKLIPTKEVELIMCLILMGLAVFLLIYTNKQLKQTNTNLIGGGVASGFLAGLVGTGGAIRGMVLVAFNLSKDVFIATSAVIDLGVDFSRSVVYYLNGYISKEAWYLIPGLIVISWVGSWTGKQILNRVPQHIFRYLVLTVIIITGIVQLVKYLKG